MFPVKYIIFGITVILGAIILYSLLVQRSDNIKTEKSNQRITENNEKIKQKEQRIIQSKNCDSLFMAMKKQNEENFKPVQQKYDNQLENRKKRKRLPDNADMAMLVSEASALADTLVAKDPSLAQDDNTPR